MPGIQLAMDAKLYEDRRYLEVAAEILLAAFHTCRSVWAKRNRYVGYFLENTLMSDKNTGLRQYC
jgi:hypothetical protein